MINRMQLDSDGNLKHLLTIDGLSKSLIEKIISLADAFMDADRNPIKQSLLKDISIFNLFFEPSTRTRTTFQIAEKNLGANIISLDMNNSATKKGETLLDTIHNLESMGADLFVIRHHVSGAASFFAKHANSSVSIINAGDGSYSHPTQALLDMATIKRVKGSISGLKIAIVGDILHSRVARSQIHALNTLDALEIRVIGPKTLVPPCTVNLGVSVYHNLEEGLKDADVIIGLRLQKERMEHAFFPTEREFYHRYGLTNKALEKAKPDAIVMHPGPVNRGVEMEFSLIDSERSVILQQVTEGIAIRMAVLMLIARPDKASEILNNVGAG